MKKTNRFFLAILCSLFSLCAGMTAMAQKVQDPLKKKEDQLIIPDRSKQRSPSIGDRIRDDSVPSNAVRVNVRYRKEYGYRWKEGVFAGSGPTSCDEFSISARLGDDVRPRNPIRIGGDSQMRESFAYYTCTYLVSDLPFNVDVKIIVTVPNNRDAWQGGSQPQPPPGQERRIPDGNVIVKLTEAQPRATLTFDMIYVPTPPKRRVRRRSPPALSLRAHEQTIRDSLIIMRLLSAAEVN